MHLVLVAGTVAQTLLELTASLVPLLSADDRNEVELTLLTLERLSHDHQSEVAEHGLGPPLVALLDSAHASIRYSAVCCAVVLCEDVHGLASEALLEAGVVPAVVRLSGAEKEAGRHETAASAMSVLARLSQEPRFKRRVAESDGVMAVLIDFARPLRPDAAQLAPLRAQAAALRALEHLAHTSEVKAALGTDPRFFPLLFSLRDVAHELAPEVAPLAEALAAHWADEFFGWAWECCGVCKAAAERLSLDKPKPPPPPPNKPQPRHQGSGGATDDDARQIAEDRSSLTQQLHEFLGHADEVTRGLLRTQNALDDSIGECEAYVRTLRQRCALSPRSQAPRC